MTVTPSAAAQAQLSFVPREELAPPPGFAILTPAPDFECPKSSLLDQPPVPVPIPAVAVSVPVPAVSVPARGVAAPAAGPSGQEVVIKKFARLGKRVLEVNEHSLLGITHEEAVNIMRSAGSTIRLVVCDGYDYALVQQMKAEGRLGHESRSTSQSVSSLDKEDRENPSQPQSASVLHEEGPTQSPPSPKLSPPSPSPKPKEQSPPIPEQTPPIPEQTPCERIPTPDAEEQLSSGLRSDTPDTDDDVGRDTPLPSNLSSASVTSSAPKEKSTPEIVMEVVRAAEQLTSRPLSQNSAASSIVPSALERKASAENKTTTVVLAKHTLAPQTSTIPAGSDSIKVLVDSKKSTKSHIKFLSEKSLI
ncbi:protein lap4-like [Macrobrachium nipponense]|uniref:protein lap4-like n=1 Tax=Macrobrachium nipponense TaxID=159736 RepID=UPI0030C7F986